MSRPNFSLVFIVINHITSSKQTHLFYAHFLEHLLLFLDVKVDEENELFSNSGSSASGCCLAFAYFFCQFHPGVAYKRFSYQKTRVFVTAILSEDALSIRAEHLVFFLMMDSSSEFMFCHIFIIIQNF